jgi:hypothetical protein
MFCLFNSAIVPCYLSMLGSLGCLSGLVSESVASLDENKRLAATKRFLYTFPRENLSAGFCVPTIECIQKPINIHTYLYIFIYILYGAYTVRYRRIFIMRALYSDNVHTLNLCLLSPPMDMSSHLLQVIRRLQSSSRHGARTPNLLHCVLEIDALPMRHTR